MSNKRKCKVVETKDQKFESDCDFYSMVKESMKLLIILIYYFLSLYFINNLFKYLFY